MLEFNDYETEEKEMVNHPQHYMSEDNCLNCIFFDKNNRWFDISYPKEYQEDYELEATWCNCYERISE